MRKNMYFCTKFYTKPIKMKKFLAIAGIALTSISGFAQNEVGTLTVTPKIGINAANMSTFEKSDYTHWFFTYEGIGHEVANLHIYTLPEFKAFVEAVLRGRQMQYDATVRDSKVVPTKWTDMNVFDLYKGN